MNVPNKIWLFILVLAVGLLNSSCKENNDLSDDIISNDSDVDIYAVGYVGSFPTLWINGVPTYLNDGTFYGSLCNDVCVSNDTVYIVGSVNDKAILWKNGEAIELTDGTHDAVATSVFCENDDVYIGYYETNDCGKRVCKIWHNGTVSFLTDGLDDSFINSIYVENGLIYACGSVKTGYYVATYWNNGKQIILTDGNKASSCADIFVKNGEVYLAFNETINDKNVGMLWHDGEKSILGDTISETYAFSVYVSNGDVYVGGINLYHAACWKNGISMPIKNQFNSSIINSIQVLNNKVYLGGSEVGEDMVRSEPRTWVVDGECTKLAHFDEKGCDVNSICVVAKKP